jgi:hypothetical protein
MTPRVGTSMQGQPFRRSSFRRPSCSRAAQQLLTQPLCVGNQSSTTRHSSQSISVPKSLLLVSHPQQGAQCLSSTVVTDGYRSLPSSPLGSSLTDMRSGGTALLKTSLPTSALSPLSSEIPLICNKLAPGVLRWSSAALIGWMHTPVRD